MDYAEELYLALPCILRHAVVHIFGKMAFKNTEEDTNVHPVAEIDELALNEKFSLWKYN